MPVRSSRCCAESCAPPGTAAGHVRPCSAGREGSRLAGRAARRRDPVPLRALELARETLPPRALAAGRERRAHDPAHALHELRHPGRDGSRRARCRQGLLARPHAAPRQPADAGPQPPQVRGARPPRRAHPVRQLRAGRGGRATAARRGRGSSSCTTPWTSTASGCSSREEREIARLRLGLPADQPLLVHFGWDWHRKGGDLFMQAVRTLRERGIEAVGVTVGGGDPARALREQLGLGHAHARARADRRRPHAVRRRRRVHVAQPRGGHALLGHGGALERHRRWSRATSRATRPMGAGIASLPRSRRSTPAAIAAAPRRS